MITVSDVKQYLYCPKIIYFDHVLHIPKHPDQKLQTGIEMHDSITAKEKRRKGAIFYDPELDQAEKMFRVEMESSTLGLRGVLDYLVRTNREFIPVDYKFGQSHKGSIHLNHKYQLAAYALLVEESFKTIVRRGFIHYSRDQKNVQIDFGDEIRRRLPGAGPEIVGGTYSPMDGHLNALRLFRATHTAMLVAGVDYRPRQAVVSIGSNDGFRLFSSDAAEVRAARIVLAAGLDNRRLAPMVARRS